MNNVVEWHSRRVRPEWLAAALKINTRHKAGNAANETLHGVLRRVGMPLFDCEIDGLPGIRLNLDLNKASRTLRDKTYLTADERMRDLQRGVADALAGSKLIQHSPHDLDWEAFMRAPAGFVVEDRNVYFNAQASLMVNASKSADDAVAAGGRAR